MGYKVEMEINIDKCKIMHIGRSNPQHTYSMDGAELTKTVKKKTWVYLWKVVLNLTSI